MNKSQYITRNGITFSFRMVEDINGNFIPYCYERHLIEENEAIDMYFNFINETIKPHRIEREAYNNSGDLVRLWFKRLNSKEIFIITAFIVI